MAVVGYESQHTKGTFTHSLTLIHTFSPSSPLVGSKEFKIGNFFFWTYTCKTDHVFYFSPYFLSRSIFTIAEAIENWSVCKLLVSIHCQGNIV